MIKVHQDFDVYVGRELRWTHAVVAEDDSFHRLTVRALDPSDPTNTPKVLVLSGTELLTSTAQGRTWDGTDSAGEKMRLSIRGNIRPCCGRK